MAHVNGRFKHERFDVVIEVLEPDEDEIDFEDGMKLMVEWDSFEDVSLINFKDIIKWMEETSKYIEYNFDKNGLPKNGKRPLSKDLGGW